MMTIENKYGTIQNAFQTKIDWPNKVELEKILQIESCSSVAKNLGVSTSAIRKKVKQYGLNMKTISPWSVKHG
jgi:transcriptional regulator of aromatic amino acid metabolism